MDQNIAVAVSIYRLNLRYQSWWSHHHPSEDTFIIIEQTHIL